MANVEIYKMINVIQPIGDGGVIINNNFKIIADNLEKNANDIAAETVNRTVADQTLQQEINSEIVNRINADANLQTQLIQEISDRNVAEANLQNNINGVTQSLSGYTTLLATASISGNLYSLTNSVSGNIQTEINNITSVYSASGMINSNVNINGSLTINVSSQPLLIGSNAVGNKYIQIGTFIAPISGYEGDIVYIV